MSKEIFITTAKEPKKALHKKLADDWKTASKNVKVKTKIKEMKDMDKLEFKAREAEEYLTHVKAKDKAKKLIAEAKKERWKRSFLRKILVWLFVPKTRK